MCKCSSCSFRLGRQSAPTRYQQIFERKVGQEKVQPEEVLESRWQPVAAQNSVQRSGGYPARLRWNVFGPEIKLLNMLADKNNRSNRGRIYDNWLENICSTDKSTEFLAFVTVHRLDVARPTVWRLCVNTACVEVIIGANIVVSTCTGNAPQALWTLSWATHWRAACEHHDCHPLCRQPQENLPKCDFARWLLLMLLLLFFIFRAMHAAQLFEFMKKPQNEKWPATMWEKFSVYLDTFTKHGSNNGELCLVNEVKNFVQFFPQHGNVFHIFSD